MWRSNYLDSTYNTAGVQDPAVDYLIDGIAANQDNEAALLAWGKALDRVLTWNHYVIPEWHTQHLPGGLLGQVRAAGGAPQVRPGVRHLVGRPGQGGPAAPAEAVSGRQMTAYIVRRLLLMIPTLWAIITINFFIVQLAPGGPVDQMVAEMTGIDLQHEHGAHLRGGAAGGGPQRGGQQGERRSVYRGARGLAPEMIDAITPALRLRQAASTCATGDAAALRRPSTSGRACSGGARWWG